VSLTGGNRHDVTQLIPLIDKIPPVRGRRGRHRQRPDELFADRAYDHVEGHTDRGRHRRGSSYPAVLDELIPSAWHHVERYANNRIEADHSQLKHRLRPMRGLRTDRTAGVIMAGHAFMQNLRRHQYEIGLDVPPALRVAAAFVELARAI
jgi:hypothetical protein